jgi:D-serine deaminase-like pyridoxal phosphate-dependent protein
MKFIRPTLLLDEKKCRDNIRRMVKKAKDSRVSFRPHFKTHQSAEIGEWFKLEGTEKITVSSVAMAEYFANEGWQDILIAFPVNILEIENINLLAQKINLSLMLESAETIHFLDENLTSNTGVWIKIDTGYQRTGISWDNQLQIGSLVEMIKVSSRLNFKGFIAHSGHTYQAQNTMEIVRIYNDTIKKLIPLKKQFSIAGFSPVISVGDTPSCSAVKYFKGADEIRPGNFVFCDVMQFELGSCGINDIAVVLVCPVVSVYVDRNEFVIYGGAIHLSKEFLVDSEGNRYYGRVVKLLKEGWTKPLPETYVKSLSQEHGVVRTTRDLISEIQIGDVIGILPVHSCLTAHQMNQYLTLEGKSIPMMKNQNRSF